MGFICGTCKPRNETNWNKTKTKIKTVRKKPNYLDKNAYITFIFHMCIPYYKTFLCMPNFFLSHVNLGFGHMEASVLFFIKVFTFVCQVENWPIYIRSIESLNLTYFCPNVKWYKLTIFFFVRFPFWFHFDWLCFVVYKYLFIWNLVYLFKRIYTTFNPRIQGSESHTNITL